MAKQSTAPRGRTGPHLSPDVTDSITQAVLLELAEVGFGQLSMDSVARRAGSGKSTLYRRWPSKQEMIMDAVAQVSVPHVEFSRADSLETVVAEMVMSVEAWLSDDLTRRIVPDLIAEAMRNPSLDDALTNRIGLMRRNIMRDALVDRIATGEVAPDADIDYALDLLAAPLFWRLCGRRQRASEELRANAVQSVLDVLRPRSATS